MDLPIQIKFEDTLTSLVDQKYEDKIRILDIDGVYLVSLWRLEKETKKFNGYQECAFDSLWEAKGYLLEQLDVEIDVDPREYCKWSDYEY